MAKMSGKMGVVGLVVFLVAVVALLPMVRSMFAPVFPEGFRDLDCKGVTCKEGEFCQENVCHRIYPEITNKYF
jgi:hypothetical protein